MTSNERSAAPRLPLVPWPRRVERASGELALSGAVVATHGSLEPAAQALARSLERLGVEARARAGAPGEGDVALALDAGLRGEACRFECGRAARISASSPRAVAQAAATLLQLAKRDDDGVARVPRLTILDEPDCEYRGLLLDVARRPHSVRTIERMVELCRLYKLNFLQLHLTDDESFTFPSGAFPRLAAPGRGYTVGELRHLESFSQARGVTIVPEIEMPGHCGAAIAAMPELLRASEKHPATINFADPRVVAILETLIGEALAIFASSPWFHVGGDECDLAFVHENPAFPRAFARERVDDAHGLHAWFLGRMNEVVRRHGRRTLVWEGFRHGVRPEVPRDVTVMVYETAHHRPDCLVRDGYAVINASWRPLYVVNGRCWPPEEIHAWDRFRWNHFVEGFPAFGGLRIEPASAAGRVAGAQLCAWEQPESAELPSLRQRAAVFAERAWNPGAGGSFAELAARVGACDAVLDRLTDR